MECAEELWCDVIPLDSIYGDLFYSKLNLFLSSISIDNFVFISDFDHTITNFSSKQCHSIFLSASNKENFKKAFWDNYNSTGNYNN